MVVADVKGMQAANGQLSITVMMTGGYCGCGVQSSITRTANQHDGLLINASLSINAIDCQSL